MLVLVVLLQLLVPLFDQIFTRELKKLLCNRHEYPGDWAINSKHLHHPLEVCTRNMILPAGCGSWLGCYSFWFCYLTSPKKGSTQIKDPTNGSSIPTKTKTVLPSLYVLPNAYYERMEPNHYVCWLNIRLVLAFTLKMLLSQRWM
jgi:hypothetical protein